VIDVVQDSEGVRMALEEIFEEDYVRSRIDVESAGASAETRERMSGQIPPRTLSPGYYVFALHLLRLDCQRKAGIVFAASQLACHEADGLVALDRARVAFESRHPPCSGCGARQANRFAQECCGCGIKFRRKGK
jgi:hypothetical protein